MPDRCDIRRKKTGNAVRITVGTFAVATALVANHKAAESHSGRHRDGCAAPRQPDFALKAPH